MRVLLTGGAGLIGMALRPLLTARGHAVTAVDGTDFGRGDAGLTILRLEDTAGLERLAADAGIEAIVHCGAVSGPMLLKDDPLAVVRINIDATAGLLDIARRQGMRRFVYCSSIGVYGSNPDPVVTEDAPLRPTSVYAATKAAGEMLVRAYAVQYGLSGVSFRPSRVYGPWRRTACHIHTMIRDAAAGRVTRIPGDAAFKYHYVYVDDVAEALAAGLEAEALPHFEYTVDSGLPLTMPEVMAVARTVIPDARIELVPGADEVSDVQMKFDVSRLAADLGWRPRFNLARGIAAYLRDLPPETALGPP
jgi:UDP-glucose 4-epimerase